MMPIQVSWEILKSFILARGISVQWIETDEFYSLYAIDATMVLTHYMMKSPSDTTSLDDFTTNFKAKGNRVLDPIDVDGSPLERNKVAPLGWTYQDHSFQVTTASLTSVFHKKPNLSNFNFITVKFYKDENGTECIDQTDADTNCIQTVLTWEPNHDYEMIGGITRWYSTISDDVLAWVTAVPDIPAIYGGSKEMISCNNLRFIPAGELHVDGRATKRLNYSAAYHTNKFQFIFRHPAGYKLPIQITMEFYKP